MYQILLVDDREIFLRQFARMPAIKNNTMFQISCTAQNGIEALQVLREKKIDIVITDIRMPLMDGIALLKKVKEEKLCDCMILLSEYADFTYAKEGMVLGALDYIVKPIDEEQLEKTLKGAREYLEKQEQTGSHFQKEIEIVSRLMLEKDEAALSIIDSLFQKILTTEKEKVGKIFADILDELEAALNEKAPYLQNYMIFSELLNREVLLYCHSLVEMKNTAENMLRVLFIEMNKYYITAKNNLVREVCVYILMHIEDDDISLNEIAERYYVNRTYLSHIFKQEMQDSFVTYVGRIKMERAKLLLRTTDIKVYEVAALLGYQDAEYFSKIFKKYTGVNAGSYIKGKG